MAQATYPRVAAAALIVLDFAVLEIAIYPFARLYTGFMNPSADQAVLFVVLPAILLLALFRGHDLGVGIAAPVIGVVFVSLISPQEPVRVAPLFIGLGGILAVCAHALKVRVMHPVPEQTGSVR